MKSLANSKARLFLILKNMNNIEYRTIVVSLPNNSSTVDSNSTKLPDGNVVGVGVVSEGNNEGEIINFSILENGNEVLAPSDLRFSERVSGGGFINSLRPVDFAGGREYEVRLSAYKAARTNEVKVQVLFAILKNSK